MTQVFLDMPAIVRKILILPWISSFTVLRNAHQCSGYDMKQSDGEAFSPVTSGNAEYPFIGIAHRPTLTRSGST